MIWIERRHIYLAGLFLGHLFLVGGIFFLVTNRMEKRFIQELKNTQNTVEQIRENELLLAQDLNHTRSVLGLNVRTYDLQTKGEEQISKGKDPSSLLFQAVDTILSLKEQQEREAFLANTLRSPELSSLLRTKGLDLRREQGKTELQKKGIPYFSFSLSRENLVTIESFLGARLEAPLKESLIPRLSSFIQEQIPILDTHFSRMQTLRTQFLSICNKVTLQSILSQKGLFLSQAEETVDGIRLRYLLKAEPALSKLEVGLKYRKGTFYIEKTTYQTIETFEEGLVKALQNVDTRTSREIRLDSILTSLRTQLKETEFQKYLRSKKIRISPRERENEEYRFIDLLEENGNRIGSIGILKLNGELFLFDKDDVPITSLKRFSFSFPMQEKKKSLNQASP